MNPEEYTKTFCQQCKFYTGKKCKHSIFGWEYNITRILVEDCKNERWFMAVPQ